MKSNKENPKVPIKVLCYVLASIVVIAATFSIGLPLHNYLVSLVSERFYDIPLDKVIIGQFSYSTWAIGLLSLAIGICLYIIRSDNIKNGLFSKIPILLVILSLILFIVSLPHYTLFTPDTVYFSTLNISQIKKIPYSEVEKVDFSGIISGTRFTARSCGPDFLITVHDKMGGKNSVFIPARDRFDSYYLYEYLKAKGVSMHAVVYSLPDCEGTYDARDYTDEAKSYIKDIVVI